MRHMIKRWLVSLLVAGWTGLATAGNLTLADAPLFVAQSAPPLVMLTMSRDHKLYYEAYNDASDLNDDGQVDTRYKPDEIDYFGYFNRYACYDYDSGLKRFVPKSVKTPAQVASRDKTCAGGPAGEWSGDFLNYLTTSRMDALRKVFYGGYRSTDTKDLTVLERAFIPQDAHSWGKSYDSIQADGYDIRDYSPLDLPVGGKRHLFANTTLSDGGEPLLRIMKNTGFKVWEWLSKERPVAGSECATLGSSAQHGSCDVTPEDLVVRVEVCKTGLSEPNCKVYPSGTAKPTGILHQYGEDDRMRFGLLTGSNDNNLQGGILRKNVESFANEVNPVTGQFSGTSGIVSTLDALRIVNFIYKNNQGKDVWYYKCGWSWVTKPLENGYCNMWGNPVAEMMYEALRYFAGKKTPTADFVAGTRPLDKSLGLPDLSDTWIDPYDTRAGGYPHCAKPFQIVISDINPSYDSDRVPGSAFASFKGDMPASLNVEDIGGQITVHEPDVPGKHFIGESKLSSGVSEKDSTPSPKQVDSLGRIRGLAPEEPTKMGSYYAASLAYWGFMNDVHQGAAGTQNVQTFAVALSSPLPTIKIPLRNGRFVTLVPFAKSVGTTKNRTTTPYTENEPTNQIVDFYVESLSATSGSFLINFEDVEEGGDHDMDAIARYRYTLTSDDKVEVKVESLYAAGSIDQHMGYVISGTSRDGIYLVVKDRNGGDIKYFLDTPAGVWAGEDRGESLLGLTDTRTFAPGFTTGATLLKNPLWYAAKWGGFQDENKNGIPEAAEWDADGDGNPDNYFPVTNALNLGPQLEKAFDEILGRGGSSASVTVNAGELTTGSLLFRALFDAANWTGQLKAFPVKADGSLDAAIWDAADKIDAQFRDKPASRNVITQRLDNEKGVSFAWPSDPASPLTTEPDAALAAKLVTGVTSGSDAYGKALVAYFRGDTSEESGQNGATYLFRERASLLGDIVHSDPLFVGAPAFFYPDVWPAGSPENQSDAETYSAYQAAVKDRTPMLYFGANDGMLHAVAATADATGGQERLAFVPPTVFDRLQDLARPGYQHQYFVDGKVTYGDAFFTADKKWHTLLVAGLGKGGQVFYGLDISDPDGLDRSDLAFSEANAGKLVKWRFDDSDDPDMGYSYGEASVVRLHNGKWAVVFGNGYNNTAPDDHVSSTGNAVLYVMEAETGKLIRKFDTGQGMSADPLGASRPNGLAAPMVVDTDGDMIADAIYAGDLFGNLWKVDVSSADEKDWDFAYKSFGQPAPLFVAKDASGTRQPVTSRVRVGRHPNTPTGSDVLVFFGTGKYLETDDKDVSLTGQPQTFYAVWDNGSDTVTRNELLQQEIDKALTVSGRPYRIVTENPIDWNVHKGWYLDLGDSGAEKGERVIHAPVLRHGRVIFTTLIPSGDVCEAGGSGWVMELDAATGGRLDYTPVDTNDDNLFNPEDLVDIDGDGKGDVYVSGFQPKDGGIPTPPAMLEDPTTYNTDNPREFKYTGTSKGGVDLITEKNNPWSNTRYSWREVH